MSFSADLYRIPGRKSTELSCRSGTSDIQFPVLYSTAVSGDRGDHRELCETWIYELYYCRPGVDRLSEREGNPVRNPFERRDGRDQPQNSGSFSASGSEEGDFSQEKQLRGYAVCDPFGKNCRREMCGDRV